MFVIRLVVCLLVIITADGLEDIKDVRQHLSSNDVNQHLDSGMLSQSLPRKKRQSVIRNGQPGQNPQVQGVDISPSLFIYVENEKDLESLLTNKTLDDLINKAERDIQSNTKTQQYSTNTITNGRNPQYQQQIQELPAYVNYNTQGVYNNRNQPAPTTTETIFLSYDQLSSYLPKGSTILNDNNQNDKIFIEVDENIKFPQDMSNTFRYPTSKGSSSNLPTIQETKATPKEIPLSISSITSQDFKNDQNTNINTKPHTKEIINRDEVLHDREIYNGYNASSNDNDRNASRDGDGQRDNTNFNKPLNDRDSPDYDRRPSNSDRRPPDYDRRPPDYDRRPYDYDRGRPDYGRRPPDYDRRPPYDRWNGGWDRRPNYGWRPPGRGPPHRGGGPPYGRGRGPPQKDKQPPYVINLNFDSKNPNGTLANDNGTITENLYGQEQNPNVYETLKSIFNPKTGEAVGKNDAEQPHKQLTNPGLFQVSPVTPAA